MTLEWPSTRSLQLSLIGLGLSVTYASLAVFYNCDSCAHNRVLRELFIWSAVLTLIVLYVWGYDTLRRCSTSAVFVLTTWAAVFALLGVCIPPFQSCDLGVYASFGWLQYHYHLNPYVDVATQVPDWRSDPMLQSCFAGPPAYGFAFILLTRFICMFGNGQPLLTMILLKGVNVLAFSALGLTVFAGARRLGRRRPDLALYLFLWSPYVVLQGIANGHNDILAAVFLTLAMCCALFDLWPLVIMALVAGTLVKYVAVVVIPFALIFAIRRKGAVSAAVSLIAGALVFGLLAAPYIGAWSRFRMADVGTQLGSTSNSLESVFFYSYEAFVHLAPALRPTLSRADMLLKTVFALVAAILLLLQVAGALKDTRRAEYFIAISLFAELLVVVVGNGKFHPWYILMFMPVAMLMGEESWLGQLTIMLSVTELLAFTFIGRSHILNPLLLLGLPMVLVGVRNTSEIKSNLLGEWSDDATRGLISAVAPDTAKES